jgi:hypothetical protein
MDRSNFLAFAILARAQAVEQFLGALECKVPSIDRKY